MSATEEVIRSVVQGMLDTLRTEPDVLDEVLWELPTNRRAQAKAALVANPPELQDAWPAVPPETAVVVVVIPGEAEEAQQYLGSFADEWTTNNGDGTGQVEAHWQMWMSATHHIVALATNMLLVTAVSHALMLALFAARRILLLEENGLYESRVIQGPMEENTQWSAQNGPLVFQRGVHLQHLYQVVHSTKITGRIVDHIHVFLHNDVTEADGSVEEDINA